MEPYIPVRQKSGAAPFSVLRRFRCCALSLLCRRFCIYRSLGRTPAQKEPPAFTYLSVVGSAGLAVETAVVFFASSAILSNFSMTAS